MDNEQVPVPPVTPQFPPPVVPPVAPPVAGPPAPPVGPTAPPAVVYPPPVPVPPSRAGRTAALVIGIVVGVVVVIGGLGAAIFWLAQSAITTFETAEPSTPTSEPGEPTQIDQLPLIEGEPSSPIAAEPFVCDFACFSQGMLPRAVPARDALVDLGLPTVSNPLGVDATSPDTEYTTTSRTWVQGEGDPEECFFTYLSVPIAATLGQRPATSTDQIDFLSYAYSADEYSYLTMSTRLFRDSASAEEHMTAMHALVPGCTEYDIGTGADYWTADVSTLPALTLPPSVGATGWVEDGPFGRYYIVDLQRGNLVVRSMLGTDGAVTEQQFRSFLEDYAVKLAELDQVQ